VLARGRALGIGGVHVLARGRALGIGGVHVLARSRAMGMALGPSHPQAGGLKLGRPEAGPRQQQVRREAGTICMV
jgi:hypothetical protein